MDKRKRVFASSYNLQIHLQLKKNHRQRIGGIRNSFDFNHCESIIERKNNLNYFHRDSWLKILTETYGFGVQSVILKESGQICLSLPLIEVDSWLTGRRGISLPFTDFCEPYLIEDKFWSILLEKVKRLACERSWEYVEFRGGEKFLKDEKPFTCYYGHRLSLAADVKGLFSRLKPSVQRAIRKAQSNSIEVKPSEDIREMKAFYNLHCLTRKRHGLPPQPFRFFENIHRRMVSQNKGSLLLAHYKSRPIAGALFLHFGKKAIFKFGTSDNSFQNLRPNNLLFWKALTIHKRHGFEEMDFGRTDVDNLGLRKFKQGWGAEENIIHYYRYKTSNGRFVSGKSNNLGSLRKVFRYMPISVSRLIGNALYRHVA